MRSDPDGECPVCFVFAFFCLMTAAQPAMSPSGGANAKSEQAAYKQAYNKMGGDIIGAIMPAVKSKSAIQALYAAAKKEVKEEMKDQAQKQVDKVVEKAKSNLFMNKSKEDLKTDQATFTKMIETHKDKLNDFKKDPIGNSGKDWLKAATKDNPSHDVLLKRAEGRIPALEKQIRKQEGELEKINQALNEY